MSEQTFLSERDRAERADLLRWYATQIQPQTPAAAPAPAPAAPKPTAPKLEGSAAVKQAMSILQGTGLPEWWQRTQGNIWQGWQALTEAPEQAWKAVESFVASGRLAAQGEGGHALAEAGGGVAQGLQAGFGLLGFPFTPFIAPVQAAFEEAAGILPGADAPLDLTIGGVEIKLTPRQIAGIVGMSAGVAGASKAIPTAPKTAEVPPAEVPPATPKPAFEGQVTGPTKAPGQRQAIAALNPAPPELIGQATPAPRLSARELLRRADTLEQQKAGLGERGKAILDEQITAYRTQAEQAAVLDLTEQTAATALRQPEIAEAVRTAVQTGKLLLPPGRTLADLGEAGRANLALTYALGRATVGALYGGTQGDTLEERLQNGLLYAGLGAALSPTAFRQFTTTYARAVEGLLETPAGGIRVKRGEARPGINLNRVGAAPDVKQTMATVYELSKPKIAAQQARVSHKQTLADAAATPLTVEEALALDPEMIGREAPRETNLRDLSNAAATHVTELMRKAVAGDTDAMAELPTAATLAGELAIRDKAFGTNVARSLEARKMLSDADRATLRPADLADLQERLRGTGLTPQALLDRLRQLPQPEQRTTFLQQLVSAAKTGNSWIREAFINGLLSAPPTHVANFLGNVSTLWALPERAMAAGFRSVARTLGSETAGVAPGESVAMARAIPEGGLDAITLVGRLLREAGQGATTGGAKGLSDALTGIEAELRGKVEWDPAIRAPQWMQDRMPALALAFDYLGHVVRSPGMALGLSDAVSKAVNYRMELKAQALREAYAQGVRGPDLAERVQAIEENPPSSIVRAANEFKLVQTFQNDLEGGIGGALEKILTGVNQLPLGFTVAPFIRTLINLPRYAGQRTPMLNLLSSELRRDLGTPGASRDLALAKLATSALVGSGVAYLIAGGSITGSGPKDPALREMRKLADRPPNSIKVGSEWIPYDRIDPPGLTIGAIADFMEIVGQIPEAGAIEIGAALTLAMTRQIQDKPYFTGLSNVVEAVRDPNSRTRTYVQSLARASVPAAVRLAERLQDPTLREAQGVIDTWRANTPGFSDTLPPRRNVWGEPQLIPEAWGPDWLSPVFVNATHSDAVSREVDRLGVALEKPSRIFYGTKPPDVRLEPARIREGIELTPQEYDFLVRMAGNELKAANGLGAKDAVAKLIQTDTYRRLSDGPDGGKASQIRAVVSTYRQMATVELLRRDEALRAEWYERQRVRATARSGRPALTIQ